jgi:hypothetical protein
MAKKSINGGNENNIGEMAKQRNNINENMYQAENSKISAVKIMKA